MNSRHAVKMFLGLCLTLLIYKTSFHLVATNVLLLVSLLIIFKAPTSDLWLLAVIVSEYSIIFAGITGILLLNNLYVDNASLFEIAADLAALCLYILPIVRAYIIGQTLSATLKNAFKSAKNQRRTNDRNIFNQPFSFNKLFQTVPTVPFRTFTYVTYEDTSLTLDYYQSTIAGKRPCVVVIHGGAWCRGDSKQLPELNSHLARAGYHCAAISYRLVPQWQFPSPIEDTTAALNYLCNHADELNIDNDNFVLLGRSAGGQIALLTAYTLQQSNIKGVINFYGPADMIWGYLTPTNSLVIDSTNTLRRFIGGDYYEIPEKYAASSPIEFVNKKTTPTLMFYGHTDALVFHEHGRRLSAKLSKHGVPHYSLELTWATHGFDYHLYGPAGQLSTYSIEYFLSIVTCGR